MKLSDFLAYSTLLFAGFSVMGSVYFVAMSLGASAIAVSFAIQVLIGLAVLVYMGIVMARKP
jgi:hypothetical protein